MPVTETVEALGSFELELLGNVPREVLDEIQFFGHIAVVPGRMDPRQYGDGTLDAARYVGVVRTLKIADDGRTNLIQDDIRVGGVGMNFWLGDENGKGPVIETLTEFTGASFNTVMNALRPASVTSGTLGTVTGSYTGRHQYQTARDAIAFVCQTMSTDAVPVSYRVNKKGQLDAGPESGLYVTTPTCLVVRKGSSTGEDLAIRSIPGNVDLDQDMEDFSTRVLMLAEINNDQVTTGTADIDTIAPGVNVFKDLHGNDLAITRLVSESDTLESTADARAEINLRAVIDVHRNLTLATEEYDIYGSFAAGDYIYLYDPDAGLLDLDNEIYIRGSRLNPIKIQVTETEWPVTQDYTVGYRNADGEWFDITDYIHWEEASTSKIVVGDFNRELNGTGESVTNRVASIVPPDNSIPNAPVLTIGATDTYLDGNGFAKAAQSFSWTVPTNTDGSTIVDGDRYELQYRRSVDSLWTPFNIAWGQNDMRLLDLSVGVSFVARIRAIDRGNNMGAFSSASPFTTASDNLSPSDPAAPTVAASTLAVQITHTLGKASGGTFNLEPDLAALEVHMGSSSGFTPSASGTYIGSMRANQGMMAAFVPAIETFDVSSTSAQFFKVIAVDTSGNKSNASAGASATATLVDSAHISDLTVTKLTAGTLGVNVLLAASIRTATSGARTEMSASGFAAFNSSNVQTFKVEASTGDVEIIGSLMSGVTGQRVEVNTDPSLASIRLYADNTTYGELYADEIAGTATVKLSTSDNIVGGEAYSAALSLVNDSSVLQSLLSTTIGDEYRSYVWLAEDHATLFVNDDSGIGAGPSLHLRPDECVVEVPFSADVTTATSGLTAGTGWSVSDFEARETCGVVQFRCFLTRTGATLSPSSGSNGNIVGDPVVCTLPSGWRPTQEMRVCADGGGTATGIAAIRTNGQVNLLTMSNDIAGPSPGPAGNLTITGTFVI